MEILKINNNYCSYNYLSNLKGMKKEEIENLEKIYQFDLPKGTKINIVYSDLFVNSDNMILCNNIPDKFPEIWENMDSLEYFEDLEGNIYNYYEAQEKIEELQEQIEELEELEENQEKIEELQEIIDSLEDAHYHDIFQWFFIDDNLADYLKRFTDEIVGYIEELDVYCLGVTHWGTAWDYVGSELTI